MRLRALRLSYLEQVCALSFMDLGVWSLWGFETPRLGKSPSLAYIRQHFLQGMKPSCPCDHPVIPSDWCEASIAPDSTRRQHKLAIVRGSFWCLPSSWRHQREYIRQPGTPVPSTPIILHFNQSGNNCAPGRLRTSRKTQHLFLDMMEHECPVALSSLNLELSWSFSPSNPWSVLPKPQTGRNTQNEHPYPNLTPYTKTLTLMGSLRERGF